MRPMMLLLQLLMNLGVSTYPTRNNTKIYYYVLLFLNHQKWLKNLLPIQMGSPKKTLEPKFLDTRSRTHHYTNAIDADYLIYSY